MIANFTSGSDFGGLARYLKGYGQGDTSDKKAVVLGAAGVRTDTLTHLIADFELGQKLHPELGKAVLHISLSFNPDDATRMTNQKMRQVAEDYMAEMDLKGTQYLLVRHHDRPHHHLHIMANRVATDGHTITDGNNFFASQKALSLVMAKHELTPAKGHRPHLQHPERLRGGDLAKYEIRETLRRALATETQRGALLATLREQGVIPREFVGKDGNVTGISFQKDGYACKGSALGRELSLAGIDKQLAANQRKALEGVSDRAEALAFPRSKTVEVPMSLSPPVGVEAASILKPVVGAEVGALPREQALVSSDTSAANQQVLGARVNDPSAAPPASAAPAVVEVMLTADATATPVLSKMSGQHMEEALARWEAEKLAEAELDRWDAAYGAWLDLAVQVRQQVAIATHEALTTGTTFSTLLERQGLALLPATADEPGHVQQLTSGEVFPLEEVPVSPLLLTPASQAAAQYGFIQMADRVDRPAPERLALVREHLLEAGLTVGPVEPAGPGRPAQLAYAFSPQQADLTLVESKLNEVQASTKTWVFEAPHALPLPARKAYGPAVPRAQWSQREGQFNQARVEIGNADQRAPDRADRIRQDLRQQGVLLDPVQTDGQGRLTFELRYHTLTPAIEAINLTLYRVQNAPGIHLRESEQQKQARDNGIVITTARQASKGYELE